MTKSLNLTQQGKDEFVRTLDVDFEDFDNELEWSDNDVKDDSSLSNVSLSSSGINETEATAGMCNYAFLETYSTSNLDPVYTVPDPCGHDIEFGQVTVIFTLTTVSMISFY